MKKKLSILLLGVLVVLSGCATAVSPAREAYIRAKPHGWLDITIHDQSIPARPPRENEDKDYPLSCRLGITINHEHYLSDELYPHGSTSPFTIKTGFRIAVPEGHAKIELSYKGCKVFENEVKTYTAEVIVTIRKGYITPLLFDGTNLVEGTAELNVAVTLETINDRLKNIESIIDGVK